MDKSSKNSRTLDMYVRLCEGKIINKSEEAKRFGVDERSIQRDIDDIRTFLSDRAAGNTGEGRTIIYDRVKKGFVLSGAQASSMTNSEVLAVSKILLESRAFTKNEINNILHKMVSGCVPVKNMKLVSDLLANEKYHYVQIHEDSLIQDKLWELGEAIRECQILEISYRKQGATEEETVKRLVEPVAVIFSEYYFYLNAYIVEKDSSGKYMQKHDYPTIFRIDRIVEYKKLKDKFKIVYADRFEEGEFRKRIQFMYAGQLMKIQFKYAGACVEAVLDRLPTAKVISETDGAWVVEAEVFGKGILMWLLSQGSAVTVLKPEVLRNEMKTTLHEMLVQYEKKCARETNEEGY